MNFNGLYWNLGLFTYYLHTKINIWLFVSTQVFDCLCFSKDVTIVPPCGCIFSFFQKHFLLELWYCSCLMFLLCCTFNTYLTRIGITLLWEVVFIWRKMERLFLFSIAWLYQRLPASTSPYVPSTLARFLVNILYMVLKTEVTEVTDF